MDQTSASDSGIKSDQSKLLFENQEFLIEFKSPAISCGGINRNCNVGSTPSFVPALLWLKRCELAGSITPNWR